MSKIIFKLIMYIECFLSNINRDSSSSFLTSPLKKQKSFNKNFFFYNFFLKSFSFIFIFKFFFFLFCYILSPFKYSILFIGFFIFHILQIYLYEVYNVVVCYFINLIFTLLLVIIFGSEHTSTVKRLNH